MGSLQNHVTNKVSCSGGDCSFFLLFFEGVGSQLQDPSFAIGPKSSFEYCTPSKSSDTVTTTKYIPNTPEEFTSLTHHFNRKKKIKFVYGISLWVYDSKRPYIFTITCYCILRG